MNSNFFFFVFFRPDIDTGEVVSLYVCRLLLITTVITSFGTSSKPSVPTTGTEAITEQVTETIKYSREREGSGDGNQRSRYFLCIFIIFVNQYPGQRRWCFTG